MMFNYIHKNLTLGRYDDILFSEEPKLTEELNVIKLFYSRTLIQVLFTKCQSARVLQFWLHEQNIPLPQDTLGLVVNLGNNIVVLKYLNENGFFDKLIHEEKTELLIKANRFPGEGLDYLKQIFEIPFSNTHKITMS